MFRNIEFYDRLTGFFSRPWWLYLVMGLDQARSSIIFSAISRSSFSVSSICPSVKRAAGYRVCHGPD